MIGKHFLGGFSGGYDVDELRELSDSDNIDDEPDPNYVCRNCNQKRYINDYQKYTPAWCEECCAINRHKKLAE